jgi:adenylosuccinate synthase
MRSRKLTLSVYIFTMVHLILPLHVSHDSIAEQGAAGTAKKLGIGARGRLTRELSRSAAATE